MDWQQLDGKIGQLHELISSSFSPLTMRWIKHPGGLLQDRVYDWRPAWDLAREIQEDFKSGIRYPNASARDAAWTRFNNERSDLSRRSNADRETEFSVSTGWRDKILAMVEGARYSRLGDMITFFDPMTAEDMKGLSGLLKEAGRLLSENKHQMLREHKDECFQRIQEIRATHDAFWGRYKEEREVRQQQYRERIRDVLTRVEQNISNNRDKRAKAEIALERCEENISKLDDMLGSARSDEHRDRVEGWLSEAREKRASIWESIRRIEEWIEQDETRRSDILSKMR